MNNFIKALERAIEKLQLAKEYEMGNHDFYHAPNVHFFINRALYNAQCWLIEAINDHRSDETKEQYKDVL
jgi:hypothetical protein